MGKKVKTKRAYDVNVLAHRIVQESTGQVPPDTRDPKAVERGQIGASKGGSARAAKLTPAKRKAIAKNAAAKRWNKD